MRQTRGAPTASSAAAQSLYNYRGLRGWPGLRGFKPARGVGHAASRGQRDESSPEARPEFLRYEPHTRAASQSDG